MSDAAGVVIVGAGQGGFQVAASLRQDGYGGPVTLVGDEPGLPYQRPPLSKAYLLGKMPVEQLQLRPEDFYAKNNIELITGDAVTELDRPGRSVLLASGRRIPYGHLVLAVGSRPRALPVPGSDLDGVLPLRTLAETDELQARVERAEHIVVVGGGFIGLEFAAAADQLGRPVTVVEALPRVMSRAVTEQISQFFTAEHERRGVQMLLGTGVTSLVGEDGRVTGVQVADGRLLPADLVLVGIGVVPDTALAARAGLVTDNGVVVDENLLTDDPHISAIGDCAAFPVPYVTGRIRLESVQNAVDQARCVAARLVGKPEPYTALPWFWTDQYEYKLQIAGIADSHDSTVLRPGPKEGSFSIFCFRGGKLVAVESVNRVPDHMVARKLLAGGVALTPEQAADPQFDLKAHVQAAAKPSAQP